MKAAITFLTWVMRTARLTLGGLFSHRKRFRVLNVSDDEVMSGDVTVRLAVYDTKIGDQQLELFMDGNPHSSGFFDFLQEDASAQTLDFTLVTQELTNGPHLISVQDSPEHSTSTCHDCDARRIICHNAIHGAEYSPLFSTAPGESVSSEMCRVRARLAPPQIWQVLIQRLGEEEDGGMVRQYGGDGDTVEVEWDGTDDAGQVVANGTFMITIIACEAQERYECLVNKVRN